MKILSNKIFQTGLIIKGVNGFLQIFGGIVIYFFNSKTILARVSRITNTEILLGFNEFQHVFASYLFANGIIKVLLVVAIFKKKQWAFPLALVLLSCFIVFQINRIFIIYNHFLLLIIIFNLIMLGFIKKQYEVIKVFRATGQ